MSLSDWIQQAKDLGFAALAKTSQALGAGAGFVRSAVAGTWLFGSTESSDAYDDGPVDEKHYFLVPDRRAEIGFSLYVMRCLPEGVPPVNELPKRRFLHLPSEHAAPAVEHIAQADARQDAQDEGPSEGSVGSRLNDLADQIDKLDDKLFNGVLLIGGLVALINPVAGAAVALKALVPSIGVLLSKYGLKYVGEAATEREMASKIKKAEKEVLRQFQGTPTESLVNPLLADLERALNTDGHEYEPVLNFDAELLDFGEQDRGRLRKLTCQAITNTYEDLVADKSAWEAASLGPEDIRYLELLKAMAE